MRMRMCDNTDNDVNRIPVTNRVLKLLHRFERKNVSRAASVAGRESNARPVVDLIDRSDLLVESSSHL